jgi:STE24 endopeptidase
VHRDSKPALFSLPSSRRIGRLAASLLLTVCLGGWAADAPAPKPSSPVAASATPAGPAAVSAGSEAPPPQFRIRPADDAWRASLALDAEAATQAYLDRLPADVVARSNAYAEGGYWLQLWNWLLGLAIAAALMFGRRAARMRDWAQRVGRKAVLRDALFGVLYTAVAWVLTLPLTIYQGFVREHQYAMATQGFGAWFGEQVVGLVVTMAAFAFFAAVFYAVVRRAGERWWMWGALVGVGLLVLQMLVSPVFIDPLFNTYKPLEEGPVKRAVLAMAQADGVPADNDYEFDASRQTTQVSANVTGLFGDASVRLNDNLLRRSTLPEIRAVMGHELGHYVMHHIWNFIVAMGWLLFLGFAFTQWAMRRLLARWGDRWEVRSVADVATLPLFLAVISTALLVLTPATNTLIRQHEIEADRFGLNLSREPHGLAEVVLKLTEYRKPDPSPLEEIVFFDHPSTRHRIHDAMRWRQAMETR